MAKYTTKFLEKENIWLVENPNGGPRLAYSPDSGVSLIEVTEGEHTYAFKDLNKNGVLDPYEDWRLPVLERAEDLASRLDLDQISGLMLYPVGEPFDTEGSINPSVQMQLEDFGVRFLLTNQSTRQNSVPWNNRVQAWTEKNDPHGIPVNVSSDPRNTVMGGRFTLFGKCDMSQWPGNLGLAATFDPNWVLLHGQITSKQYRAYGIGTGLSPQVDLATEPRWSRFSGTFGEGSKLAGDMAAAYVRGFQSTWEGLGPEAKDLGWGKDSVVTMIKHFPSDGAAEGGREAHNNFGKFNVYPGDNMAEHWSVFDKAFHIPESSTGGAKAVMPSYSIAIGNNGPIGQPVGSGYSKYKLTDLLKDQLGYDGLVCCDWDITTGKCWGVENDGTLERHYKALKAGLHMFGGSNDADANREAYDFGLAANKKFFKALPDMPKAFFDQLKQAAEGEDPKVIMDEIFYTAAVKCLSISFYNGLFEDPYVIYAEADEAMDNPEFSQIAYDCQKASVVLLKNQGGIIKSSEGKKTVYVPMAYDGGMPGFMGMAPRPAEIYVPFDNSEKFHEFFDLVTDTISPTADSAHLLPSDIIRRTDFTGVDMAIITASNPDTGNGFHENKVCMEPGKLDNGYYPVSLQYGPYYADPAVVREPMGLDPDEECAWVAAGGKRGHSRYYGGKTVEASNGGFIDTIKAIREAAPDLPVAVYLTVNNPMCFYEFEPMVQAIVAGFSVSDDAAAEILAGRYEPQGLLPCQMPANMETVEKQFEDVPFDMDCHVDTEGNVYDYGYGLNWSGKISDWRTEKYGR